MAGSPIGELPVPTRDGFDFDGWMLNGELVDAEFVPEGDIELVAEWSYHDSSKYAITYNYGDLNFDGQSHLNTGIKLFSTNAINDDFSLTASVANDEFLEGQNNGLNTILSAMDESGTPWPGIVFRRNATQFDFTANASSSKKFSHAKMEERTVTVVRTNNRLSVVGRDSYLEMSDFARSFDVPLTFGASLSGNNPNSPFRFYKGDLNDIVVTKQYSNAKDLTLPTPNYTKNGCAFEGWVENGGEVQATVVIPAGSTGDKSYEAVFTCQAN